MQNSYNPEEVKLNLRKISDLFLSIETSKSKTLKIKISGENLSFSQNLLYLVVEAKVRMYKHLKGEWLFAPIFNMIVLIYRSVTILTEPLTVV